MILAAHNGKALFHADKYIYIYENYIYIKRNRWKNVYKELYIHPRNWRLCRKAITYMDVFIIPYLT